jgi:hypothetical protein
MIQLCSQTSEITVATMLYCYYKKRYRNLMLLEARLSIGFAIECSLFCAAFNTPPVVATLSLCPIMLAPHT